MATKTMKQMITEIYTKVINPGSFPTYIPPPRPTLPPVKKYDEDQSTSYWRSVRQAGGPENYAKIIVFLESQQVPLVESYAQFKKDWPGYFETKEATKC